VAKNQTVFLFMIRYVAVRDFRISEVFWFKRKGSVPIQHGMMGTGSNQEGKSNRMAGLT
jgi:hypothetical protein